MDAHREDERIVLSVRKIELLHPQSLHDVRIDIALRAGTTWYRLKWRPIIEMPIRWDLYLGTISSETHAKQGDSRSRSHTTLLGLSLVMGDIHASAALVTSVSIHV